MATFSIVSHEDAPDDLVDPEMVESAQVDVGAGASLRRPRRETMRNGPDADLDSLPLTLLELPDLVAVSQWTDQRWSNLGNRVFWVGIVVGSVLALYLIWQPKRAAAPQREAPPTWSGQAATSPTTLPAGAHEHGEPHTHATAPAWPAHETPAASAATIEAESETFSPQPPSEPETPPPGQEAAPSFNEWSRQPPAPQAVYTARGGDTRMDGGAAQSVPGEAMPTGKIKSVVTP
ncbi:MAG: hypothetical protein WD845_00105 [Pirellulales bacterium]